MPVSDTVYIDIIANAAKSIAGIAKLGAAYLVVSKIMKAAVRIGADLIDSYREQEQAEAKLTAALRATGRQYTVSLRSLTDFAGELQSVTTYGDEATISAMAMLQQLGNLDEQGLRKLTPLVQDFATAMGIDLQTAASLVGKTLGSSTNALARYGVVLDASAPKGEKLATLIAILEKKFGGFSRQVAQTGSGALTILNNIMGDIKEEGGRKLLEFLQPAVKHMNDFLAKTLQTWAAQRNLNKALKGEATSIYEMDKAIKTNSDRQSGLIELQKQLTLYNAKGLALDAGIIKRGKEVGIVLADISGIRQRAVVEIAAEIQKTRERAGTLAEERKEIEKTTKIRAAEVIMEEAQARAEEDLLDLKARGGDLQARYNKELLQGIELGKYVTSTYEQLVDLSDRQNMELLKGIDYTGRYEEGTKKATGEWEDYVSVGQDLLGSLDSMWSNYYDRRMAGMDEESEEYKRLAREKAESEKRWALFMATVNTAVAVVKALPNPILAAITLAAGIAQMAAIAAAPIPAMAEGGVATRPTIAMVGERGPEAIVPLSRAGMLGAQVNVFVYGSVMEGEDLARKIGAKIWRQRRGY